MSVVIFFLFGIVSHDVYARLDVCKLEDYAAFCTSHNTMSAITDVGYHVQLYESNGMPNSRF